MAEVGSKRPREGDSDGASRMAVEEFLDSMDPSVRIKLRSMLDDGSLRDGDLDDRNIEDLKRFDAAVALEVLEHYSSGDLSQVRNRRAYLAGAIRRRSHLVRPEHRLADDEVQLHPDVRDRLNELKQSAGKAGNIDHRCIVSLAELPPARALTVLDRYSVKDFSEVRNPSALFMAILRTLADDGGHPPPRGGGRDGPPPPYGHGTPWEREHDRGGGGGGWERERHGGGHSDRDRGPPPGGRPPYRGGGGGDPFYPPRDDGYGRGPPRGSGGGGGYDPIAAAAAGSGMLVPGPNGRLVLAPERLAGPPPERFSGPPPERFSGGPPPPGPLPHAAPLAAVPAAVAAPVAAVAPTGQQQFVLVQGPDGMQQYMMLATSAAAPVAAAAAPAVLPLQQQPAAPQLLGALPLQQQPLQPLAAAPQPQQMPPPAVPARPAPPEWAAGRHNYSAEQAQAGVRVGELANLSPYAPYVHPSVAIKLQSTWDAGNELVSMLDDKVWETLAELPPPDALAAVQDAASALDNRSNIRNINAFMISAIRKMQGGGPPRSSGGGDRYPGGGGGGPPSSRAPTGVPALHLLPPQLADQARELCRSRAPLLRQEHFDEGVVGMIMRLPPSDAAAVLSELAGNSFSGVRNITAFIMGALLRAERQANGGGGHDRYGGGRR